jgi:hypothetical protein
MLDPDLFVLCEHDQEPHECPICGGQEPENPVFDPQQWVDRYRATTRESAEFPDELAGVPFS